MKELTNLIADPNVTCTHFTFYVHLIALLIPIEIPSNYFHSVADRKVLA